METPQETDAEQARPQIDGDALEQLKKQIFRRIRWASIPGLIALLLLVGWKMPGLAQIPGVALAADYLYGQVHLLWPLPRAKGDKFAVAIARLDNDEDDSKQELITDALVGRKDIEALVLDRSITLKGSSRPQEAIRAAQERARELLRKTNAAVMIWGQVRRVGRQRTLTLHWTTHTADEPQKTTGRYTPEETHDLELPEPFWKDMSSVLGMIVLTEQARLSSPNGQARADQLVPFIDHTRVLLQNDPRSPEEQAPLKEVLGYALATYGDQRDDNAALEKAVAVYQEALQGRSRERAPLEWAESQDHLATALTHLGTREKDTAHLEQAVAAYRGALEVRTRQDTPFLWAQTQRHLGGALQTLAERARNAKDAQDAVDAFKSSAEVDRGAAEGLKSAQTVLERLRRAPAASPPGQ
jgi:tetratricopeptide (TPR) repeat protein